MKKVLFIAHYFSPTGGAGVQRSVKFVKYLPDLGYMPVVLTGAPKPPDRWAPEDASLASEVPVLVPVHRTAPEDAALSKTQRAERRLAALIELGGRIIAQERPALIFVTMSPFDDAVVAAELSRRHGLPWVADLRDPWALDEFHVHRSRWHRWRERRLMGRRLASAASIIMNTPEAQLQFRRTFPHLAGKAVVSITNGFDPDDFKGEPLVMHPGKFNLVHSGYFHADHGLRQQRRALEYRLLGRTLPGVRLLPRSHFYLVKAVERWLRASPEIAGKIAITCLGVPSPVDQQIVDESACASLFTFTGYKPHAECLRYVQGADLLFLPMHALPAGRRATIVPGKTYEYLASGRPILAAVPEGDARDFIEGGGAGLVCEPEAVAGMVEILGSQYARWSAGKPIVPGNDAYLERFRRTHLAACLGDELSRVIADSIPSGMQASG